MKSLGWRCWASSQQSWPGVPGSHLSKLDPSLLANKQGDPRGGLTKHSRIFVSSWLSLQLPPHHLQGALGVGLQVRGSSSQAPWPPSPLAIFNHLSLSFKGPRIWSQPLSPVTAPSSLLLPSQAATLSLYMLSSLPLILWRGVNRIRAVEGQGEAFLPGEVITVSPFSPAATATLHHHPGQSLTPHTLV